MDNSPPLISIITVNFNGGEHLPKLLDTTAQLLAMYPEIEHVIVDGASKDNSCALFESYRAQHGRVRYVSERDKGIYDAMNKGVALSAGTWFIHLNSDDYAINFPAWGKAIARMKAKKPGVLATDVPIMDDTDVIRYLPGKPLSPMHRRFGFHFPHQGTFFQRSVFEACGPYRLDVGYIADKLYAFRVLDRYDAGQIDYLDDPVSVQKIGGVSSSSLLTPVKTVRLTLRLAGSGYCKDVLVRALLNLVYKLRLALHKEKKRSLAELCVGSQQS